ncbi:MAG: acyl-CoA dehydrogenase C-terminal domain-containing protein [Verrucomicrobia bacterium]|nr:acyl-CoA dehydrogenase C-terminal domain-containing protein [Verrucomicrobiota bacterium]
MAQYKAPLRDIRFLLEEVFDYPHTIATFEAFRDFDLDTVMAMVEQVGDFAANEMLPLNKSGDAAGIQLDPATHTVTTPAGYKELYRAFVEQGLVSLTQPAEFGGTGAPHCLNTVLGEIQTSCNLAFALAPGLSHGAMEALEHHAAPALRDVYLPKLVSGEWMATMCLTEPQCGTDLGLISTKAQAEGDHWKLTGTKIWITWGEHDLTENIIHLVLGRLPDAPAGIKGISLFLVPKILPDGTRNAITCGGLEHKMGIHASPTCVMNMEGAHAWLVGEPHKGMRGMFTMMNAARLMVGVQGLGAAEFAYQTALRFAKERRQSRSLNPARREAGQAADVILVHPDVRRMLLNIKASNEGLRALAYWTAINTDLSRSHPDERARQGAADLVALLTPLAKSYLTERGFDNISDAMQVCGGSGYTRDWDIEQTMRDERIAMIYEGTNHIQAIDLVGRKLGEDHGRLYHVFGEKISLFLKKNSANSALTDFALPLSKVFGRLNEATQLLATQGQPDPEFADAVASNYLNLFSLTAIAYLWCLQVKAALGQTDAFHLTKVKTARYFFDCILPETATLSALIRAGKGNMMDFAVEEF